MALSRAEIIRRATIAARKDFIGFSKQQEAAIVKIYVQAGQELVEQVYTDSRAGQIMQSRRTSLMKEIDAEVARMRTSLNAKIRAAMSQSIDQGMAGMIQTANSAGVKGNIQIGSSFFGIDGKIRRFDPGVSTLANSQWGKINQTAMDHLLRFRPTGLTFSQSIWNANWDVQKNIRNAVNGAVLTGKSSQKLAREITQYMSPTGLRTGRGVYKSAYKNAWRLTRTEINRAYHEGQIRYSKSKPRVIDGHIWRLGGSGPWRCICPDLAGRFFPTDMTPQKPHPQCMCYLEFHIVGEAKPAEKEPMDAETKKAIELAA
jgi:hypothetical protein